LTDPDITLDENLKPWAEGKLIIYKGNLNVGEKEGFTIEKYLNSVGVHEAFHWVKHVLGIKKTRKEKEYEATDTQNKSEKQYDDYQRNEEDKQ